MNEKKEKGRGLLTGKQKIKNKKRLKRKKYPIKKSLNKKNMKVVDCLYKQCFSSQIF